jgi:hypothetical protein
MMVTKEDYEKSYTVLDTRGWTQTQEEYGRQTSRCPRHICSLLQVSVQFFCVILDTKENSTGGYLGGVAYFFRKE